MKVIKAALVVLAVALLGISTPARAITIGTADGSLSLAGPLDVYWQWFVGDLTGDGAPCSPLAQTDCNVNGSPSILKIERDPPATENGTLPSTATFTVLEPSDGSGTWSYSTAPPYVTAWITKTGSTGYTVHWLSPDGDGAYTGITALPGESYPWHSIRLFQEPLTRGELSNIIFFDSDGRFPPTGLPEPGTLALIGFALAAFGLARRRIR
jgi:hypothetical protein